MLQANKQASKQIMADRLTSPGSLATFIPRAMGITKMSEKIMAASTSNLLTGCDREMAML